MTTDQSRKFIQEYISTLCKEKSEATIDKYVSDEHLKSHIIIFETGLPNYQFIPQDIIAEGNKVTVRFQCQGEHKGELFGQSPTGRKVDFDGIIIYELKDKKIVNHWIQADS
ncbi:MAG TPA: ester cyclase, partial [Lunatimonas sp.]|nr:ester cyclase [Lunatimonas sp.]